MCAQPSNRTALLEGALRCIATMPIDRISARELAKASGANLASISYHFGSKDGLLTAAIVEGLDRWLEQISRDLAGIDANAAPAERIHQALRAVDNTRTENAALARAFIVALSRGQHDAEVSRRLSEGFRHTRPRVAELLGLGSDDVGTDAGAILHSLFTGMLAQSLLDATLTLDADQTLRALQRIAEAVTRHARVARC